jgi:RimJ/RimL family protein N-acetyltransferase
MIRLGKFERLDFDRLMNWIDSEESMVQFSGPVFSYPITYAQLEKYISADNRLVYKVIDSKTEEIIGHAELNNIDHKNKSARICRILIGDAANRNKGFGKAIIKELVRIGFEDLELHRLDLGVYDFNKQAIKCYQDCGFEIEGLLRETSKVGNGYWSAYNMSILNKIK